MRLVRGRVVLLGARCFGVTCWLLLVLGLVGCRSDATNAEAGHASGSGTTSLDDGLPPDPSSSSGEGQTEGTGADVTGTASTQTEGTGTASTGIVEPGTESTTGEEPGCGNGIVDAGEDCDDGGESAACNSDCSVSECGDGITNVTAGEDCDDGGESAACNSDCSVSECGDGITNVIAGEDCDDVGESVACDVDCTNAICGDSHVNALAGEACDGVDLAGATCEGLGFFSGTLACTPACSLDPGGCANTPAIPVLMLGFSQVKRFDFSWAAAAGAEYYQLEESVAPGEPFVQVGGDIVGESISLTMPLHFRYEASYRVRACNGEGCTDSAVVDVMGSLAEAVGYFKASNTGSGDVFGFSVAMSEDGSTLAVGARNEDSSAIGIGGDQANDDVDDAGAVYVFVRDGMGDWSQQAYVKASNTGVDDRFGWQVALSGDGNTLAVGAVTERSNATGIDGDQANDSLLEAGAVYVFVRDGMGDWSQQAYVKASNTGSGDRFGWGMALSGNGNTLAVGAYWEDSNATGIGGDQVNDTAINAGAVYVFVRDGMGAWSQQAYVKASNTDVGDGFGRDVALSGDGNTLAVGASGEASNATGIGGNQVNDTATGSGAVYVFVRDGMGAWSQQAYIKASNTGSFDWFGVSVALNGDGNTLAVGAWWEDSDATGIGGDQANDAATDSGAVYVFVRDGMGGWSQQAYVKASNTGLDDWFGESVALSADGNTLAVGSREDSDATGIGGDQANENADERGAVYVFVRNGMGGWDQQAYVKASNTNLFAFGRAVALSGDSNTLAVGTHGEDSNATGIGGDQANAAAMSSGAVYLY